MAPIMTNAERGVEPEPHLMDRIYKHQRLIYDASRKYYLLGRDHLIEALSPPPRGKVLELGCGTGRNLILAAKQYPNAEFYGIDISTEMLKSAGKAVLRANLAERIHLAHADATRFEGAATFGQQNFDRIFISFSLSMIPPWQAVLETAQKNLKPGGELHIVDFGGCEKWPGLFKKGLYGWLALFHVHPLLAMKQRLEEAAAMMDNTIEIKPLYGGYSLYAKITRPL